MKELSDEYEFGFLMCFKTKPKVLIFYNNRCVECKKLFHIIEILEMKYTETDFIYIDTDNNKYMINNLRITNVPTIVFILDGHEVDRVVGYKSYNDLISILDKNSFK